jgi:hypothetical protein
VIAVALATEDELSEAVGHRLLAECSRPLQVEHRIRKNGAGYLRKRMKNWCAMANHCPVVLLTDLDTQPCPSTLIANWLGNLTAPPELLVRVAVREVESWLLADHDGMMALLGTNVRLPPDPDSIVNPKEHLLRLAGSGSRRIRRELVADAGAVARQGLGYNSILSDFVTRKWSPVRAEKRSESLRRTRQRLEELARRSS